MRETTHSAGGELDPAVTVSDVRAARDRFDDDSIVQRTPIETSRSLGRTVDGDVFLKMEHLQRTGSFKPRGTYNKLRTLADHDDVDEVVAASAGNHAQGVALELVEDVPDVDTIVVPIGGDGLIGGMGAALAAIKPDVHLIGVQAESVATVPDSLQKGHPQSLEEGTTIADQGANIRTVEHVRSDDRLKAGQAFLEFVVQTSGRDHAEMIRTTIAERGYRVRRVN